MQIEIVTKQDLEAFKDELLQALTAYMEKPMGAQKPWLRSKEVRQMLGISAGTLQNLRVKGLLHPTKVEGVYYYKYTEITDLLNAGTE